MSYCGAKCKSYTSTVAKKHKEYEASEYGSMNNLLHFLSPSHTPEAVYGHKPLLSCELSWEALDNLPSLSLNSPVKGTTSDILCEDKQDKMNFTHQTISVNYEQKFVKIGSVK